MWPSAAGASEARAARRRQDGDGAALHPGAAACARPRDGRARGRRRHGGDGARLRPALRRRPGDRGAARRGGDGAARHLLGGGGDAASELGRADGDDRPPDRLHAGGDAGAAAVRAGRVLPGDADRRLRARPRLDRVARRAGGGGGRAPSPSSRGRHEPAAAGAGAGRQAAPRRGAGADGRGDPLRPPPRRGLRPARRRADGAAALRRAAGRQPAAAGAARRGDRRLPRDRGDHGAGLEPGLGADGERRAGGRGDRGRALPAAAEDHRLHGRLPAHRAAARRLCAGAGQPGRAALCQRARRGLAGQPRAAVRAGDRAFPDAARGSRDRVVVGRNAGTEGFGDGRAADRHGALGPGRSPIGGC